MGRGAAQGPGGRFGVAGKAVSPEVCHGPTAIIHAERSPAGRLELRAFLGGQWLVRALVMG